MNTAYLAGQSPPRATFAVLANHFLPPREDERELIPTEPLSFPPRGPDYGFQDGIGHLQDVMQIGGEHSHDEND
jgi:hypothetical protein